MVPLLSGHFDKCQRQRNGARCLSKLGKRGLEDTGQQKSSAFYSHVLLKCEGKRKMKVCGETETIGAKCGNRGLSEVHQNKAQNKLGPVKTLRHEWVETAHNDFATDGASSMADRIYKLHYEKMVEEALRWVMREALSITEQQGLPGPHHFYITFRTRYPGVGIASHLLERHPDEMTIVLQNQFCGLEVGETGFTVTLSFNKANERLQVPFAAVTAFTDPAAKFGLQFNVDTRAEQPLSVTLLDPSKDAVRTLSRSIFDHSTSRGEVGTEGNVIALDAFRKK